MSYGMSIPAGLPAFPCVKLRGVPFDAQETDVIDFLHGLDVVDIIFGQKGGRVTGEVFVVVANTRQVDLALQRNRFLMGRRYIEVFAARKADYYGQVASEYQLHHAQHAANERAGSWGADDRGRGATDRYSRGGDAPTRQPNAQLAAADHSGFLKLRGVPFSATADDIAAFFETVPSLASPPPASSVRLPVLADGRPTGEAFVMFASAADAKLACIKDRAMLGTRYVELFVATPDEFDKASLLGA